MCIRDSNDAIASGRGEQIILLQEALMEERIGSLAAQIAAKKGIKFVMIAGPVSYTHLDVYKRQAKTCGSVGTGRRARLRIL